MKKIALTILLGMAIGASAQHGGGLFQRGSIGEDIYFNNGGYAYDRTNGGLLPALPNHGGTNNQDAPLDGGVAIVISLGIAYALSKKRK